MEISSLLYSKRDDAPGKGAGLLVDAILPAMIAAVSHAPIATIRSESVVDPEGHTAAVLVREGPRSARLLAAGSFGVAPDRMRRRIALDALIEPFIEAELVLGVKRGAA